jgi:hypothetical protein
MRGTRREQPHVVLGAKKDVSRGGACGATRGAPFAPPACALYISRGRSVHRLMPSRTRTLAALAAAAAFVLPLLVSLATTRPAIQRVLLTDDAREGGFPAELHGRWSVEPDGRTLYLLRMGLQTPDARAMLAHDAIAFEVLDYAGRLDIVDAELALTGSACTYRTPPGAAFPSDGALTLVRGDGCVRIDPAPGEMSLTIRLREEGHAALRTLLRSDGHVPAGAIAVSRFGIEAPPGALLARGTVADLFVYVPGATRLSLLTFLWSLSSSGAWIVAMVLAAGAMVFAAVVLAARPAAAAFLAALALAITYAAIVPPLQAADEPNHLLSLGHALGLPGLDAQALEWAERAHFEQLRSVGRPFTPVDRDRPGIPWTGIGAPDSSRGAGVEVLWWLLSPLLRDASPPRVILTVRLFNALIFACAAGLFVVIVSRLTMARTPLLLAIPIFIVPTLPYFGMHVSNYGPLVALYVLVAAGLAVAQWDGPRAHWSAVFLGAGVAFGMAVARSAVPLAGLVAAIVFARVCLGDAQGRTEATLKYWIALVATTVVGLLAANLAYPEGPERAIIRYRIAQSSVTWLLHRPWWLIVPGAAMAGIEIGVSRLTRRLSAPSRARALAVAVTAYAGAALVAAWLIVSPWLPMPVVAPLDGHAPVTLTEYVQKTLPALLAWARFGRPDVLSSITFWGGFGWLETRLPGGIVSVLAGTSGIALAALFVWIGRRRSGRALFWLACALGGYVVSAAAYTFTARLIFADVHGRYLLGLYLAALVIAWSSVARWTEQARRPAVAVSVAAACSLALHAYALTFLLARYF